MATEASARGAAFFCPMHSAGNHRTMAQTVENPISAHFWRTALPLRLEASDFRCTDIHVSLLSRKNTRGQARSRERAILGQDLQLASVPLGFGPCLRRTGHPFAASGPRGPSQKIELVFAASPETVSGEPQESFYLRRSLGTAGGTWQSARSTILRFSFRCGF